MHTSLYQPDFSSQEFLLVRTEKKLLAIFEPTFVVESGERRLYLCFSKQDLSSPADMAFERLTSRDARFVGVHSLTVTTVTNRCHPQQTWPFRASRI